MKDAIGSSVLMYVFIIIVGILGIIISVSLTYSKAYRAKNAIIETIDNYYMINNKEECFIKSPTDCVNVKTDCLIKIDASLKHMGYNYYRSKGEGYTDGSNHYNCADAKDGEQLVYPSCIGTGSAYCVYKVDAGNGYYYRVVTFSKLKLLNIKIDVTGTTRIYY